jgi:endonuclease/exonuclease/phosphatase (EEP) superfamily protein YafD
MVWMESSIAEPVDGATIAYPDEVEEGGAEWRRRLHRAWDLTSRAFFGAAWILCALLFLTTAMRQLGLAIPSVAFVLFQSLTPVVYLPLYVIAPLAAWTRRWWLCGVAVALIVVHLASVLPAIGSTATPSWAAGRPQLQVVAANVYDQNSRPDDAARVLLDRGADVIVLTELTSPFQTALQDAGIDDRYPFLHSSPLDAETTKTKAIYSRFPLTNKALPQFGAQSFKFANIEFGDSTIGLLSVHINNSRRGYDEWEGQLTDLKEFAESQQGPTVLVGDFNSNRWNTPFRNLLDVGLVDAHEVRGKGLSFSWPSSLPLIRLDHALVNDSVAILSIEDFDTPGSDHLAMEFTLVTME